MPAAATPSLASAAVMIGTLGAARQRRPRLLAWLPQERTDWTTYAQWVVRPESAAEVPVEAVPGAAANAERAAACRRRRRPEPASRAAPDLAPLRRSALS